MYNQFFGLQKAPFSMTPDPGLLFLPPRHREALAGLIYAILNRKGFAVLIGDAGTGKTTLLTRVLRSLPPARIHASVILNSTLTANEFLELALMEFGIAEVPQSKAQRLAALHRVLMENHKGGRASVLIVDEAHKLSHDLLEEVRLLSNFGYGEQNLLQIVLSGQDELAGVLNNNNLRQLKQRIAVRLSIGALSMPEVEPYIRYRWTQCGGAPTLPFSETALAAVGQASQGIPRLINAVCDNALAMAFGRGIGRVEEDHVLEVAKDLDLKLPAKPGPPEPPPVKMAAPRPADSIARPLRLLDPEPHRSMWSRWTKRRISLVD